MRLLLTALSRPAGYPLAFDGASAARVRDAFAEAMNGDYASLIQLLDAAARPRDGVTDAALSVRHALLRGDDIETFVHKMAQQDGIVCQRGPVDEFADAVSSLADTEAEYDRAMAIAAAHGYDAARVRPTPQSRAA